MDYIVILKKDGNVYFLESRNEVRVFKRKQSAINNANKLLAKTDNCGEVRVIAIDEDDNYKTTSSIVYSRKFIERCSKKYDTTHDIYLNIYELKNNCLYGELCDTIGNPLMHCEFSEDDINGDVYRVKEYFGFN